MVFWSGPALLRALVKGRAWSNHGICSLGAHQGMFPHPREERAFPLGLWLAADGQRDLHWNLELGGDTPTPSYQSLALAFEGYSRPLCKICKMRSWEGWMK